MNYYLRFTVSKIAAYIIIISSAIHGILNKDGVHMVAGFTIGAGILANKQYQDRKELENSSSNSN